jgi:GT2 family glycosyltransferase
MLASTGGIRHADHQLKAGLRGWLESPPPDAAAGDCVFVTGWAFASAARITELWAEIDGQRHPIGYGLRRDDVAAAYPAEAHAGSSGFSAYFEFNAAKGRSIRLQIWARLDDGRSERLFVRRLVPAGTLAPLRVAFNEAIARPQVFASPRAWRTAWRLIVHHWFRPLSAASPPDAMAILDRASRAVLTNFLQSAARVAVPLASMPRVSVIIVVWNRADLTFGCMRSLAAQTDAAFETIVVDNGSTDATTTLLARIDGLRIVRHSENVGFTVAANAGAAVARGEFLLFLNNDAELLPGAIGELVAAATRTERVGAVGGKLVFPDGRLQEAGSIVWADGSCEAYGRGGDPLDGEFNFERPVDFCSAAVLLTPRALFEQLHGFDERYKPAYYEDADYCVRLWKGGHRVVYEPRAVAMHREFGSATSAFASVALQRERREVFAASHRDWLGQQRPRNATTTVARSHPHGTPTLIMVDDAPPDRRLGSGFPRAAAMVHAFLTLGYRVTICLTGTAVRAQRALAALPEVEVIAPGAYGLRSFFEERRADVVVVSRPHNMQHVKAALGSDLRRLGAPCIYDAEAVFAVRDIGRRSLAGDALTEPERRALIDREVALAGGCAAVFVVSDAERRLFTAATSSPVFVVSHAAAVQPTATPFEARRSVLFVGAFGAGSPNDDAARYLAGAIVPAVRARGCDAGVVIAGAHVPDGLMSLDGQCGVRVRSDVDDLDDCYQDARAFVAPVRFGAGIPLKAIEAAARGVPVLAAPFVARQLEWENGVELVTASTPSEFAERIGAIWTDRDLWVRLRDAALARVARDFGPGQFRSTIAEALRALSLTQIAVPADDRSRRDRPA